MKFWLNTKNSNGLVYTKEPADRRNQKLSFQKPKNRSTIAK